MSLPTSLTTTLAAAPPPPLAPREGGNTGMVLLLQLVLIAAILYFILIRPQRKQQQRHREMLGKLSRGDQVMTNGGILGVIVHATEQVLTIRTGENTRIVVDRGHVARKIEAE